jgi:hypothetical protein
MNTFNTSELKDLLSQLEISIPHATKLDQSISSSNVGWHIEHSLMVFNGIIDTISKSDPKDYKGSFNIKRLVVFTKKKIPRGIAKAPKTVLPKGDFTIELLNSYLENAKIKLDQIKNLDPKQFFDHPIFGNIRLKQTIKFLAIHTNHHLDIIKDIIKSKK